MAFFCIFILFLDCSTENNLIIYSAGTADWMYLRKFSFTSSQSSMAFKVAFPDFQDNPSWIHVAETLYGDEEKWRAALNVPVVQEQEENSNEEENDTTGDKFTPPSLQVYLSRILENPAVDEADQDSYDNALEWLKIYVLGNNPPAEECNNNDATDATTDAEDMEGLTLDTEHATTIVSGLPTSQKKIIHTILLEHVHPDYRSNSIPKKDFILWLTKKNAIRSYFFYKVVGLKALMDKRKISLKGKGGSKMDRIEALAGTLPDSQLANAAANSRRRRKEEDEQLDPKDRAIKRILQWSFLPHQKGDEREHCSLGHRLEKPILKNWMKLLADDEFDGAVGLEAKSAYTAGLAAKKEMPYIKDSIDFLVVVGHRDSLIPDEDEMEVWGFEAKGRVTSATAIQEEENFSSLFFDKHLCIKDFEMVQVVRKESERFQILHHTLVYDLSAVVIAISDAHSQIIRSAIIQFSQETKEHYKNVLKEMMEFSFKFLYQQPSTSSVLRREPVRVPENIMTISEQVPNINGQEALQGTFNLFHALQSLPKPFLSFHRLIPAIYAFWNAVKGGSDTTTKLMDDCAVKVPHVNCETVASTRCVMLVFVAVHRLFQLFTAQQNLNSYASLYHYRKASAKRTTFHQTLLECDALFKKKLKELKELAEKENVIDLVTLGGEGSCVQRRRQPSRRRVDGVLPEEVTFGTTLHELTPKRITRHVQMGKASNKIEDMVRTCTGMPMKAIKSEQQRCNYCRTMKTSWYCVGCKRWLCMDRRATATNAKPLQLYSHNVKGKQFSFHKQCFHAAHEEAWCRIADNNDNGDESTTIGSL